MPMNPSTSTVRRAAGDGAPVTSLEHEICESDEDASQETNAEWQT
jgi:hypothetical protein